MKENEMKCGIIGRSKAVLMLGLAAATVCVLALVGCTAGGASSSAASASPSASAAALSGSASADASTAGTQVTPSEAAAEAGDDITVSVAMKEAVTKATDADTPLQFAEETIGVQAPEGTSALEFLKGTGREVDVQGEGADTEVVSIGGLVNGDAGEGSHWVYELNGVEQTVSPTQCFPQEGDTLTWNFVG